MNSFYNNNKKLILFSIILILISILLYKFVIIKQKIDIQNLTINNNETINTIEKKEKQIMEIDEMQDKAKNIKKDNFNDEYMFAKEDITPINIYTMLNKYKNKHKIKITEFIPNFKFHNKGNFDLIINGEYMNIIKFINEIENLSQNTLIKKIELIKVHQRHHFFKIFVDINDINI